MRIAILGQDQLAETVASRLRKEKFEVHCVESTLSNLYRVLKRDPHDVLIALSDNDQNNLVFCALAKQISDVRTIIASLKQESLFSQKEFNIERAFHIDHLIFPGVLLADLIEQKLLSFGIYSKNFFYGNVQLRTLKVPESSGFCGKTLAEIRAMAPELVVAVIHRPKRILATSLDKTRHLLGKEDEVIFGHGKDLVMAEDEITLIGTAPAIEAVYREFQIRTTFATDVYIMGDGIVGETLAARLKHKGMKVRQVSNSEDVDPSIFFVACSSDEEHNFVLALRAKDKGSKKVVALLTDKKNCEEAEKLGIDYVLGPSLTIADSILENVQQGKVTSVLSLYDAKVEVLEATISDESPIAGIPLSILGPRLPQEMLIGCIYTRGRIFIAGGAHILKPHDEVIIVAAPKLRSLIEKLF